jgi:hypothetical protein
MDDFVERFPTAVSALCRLGLVIAANPARLRAAPPIAIVPSSGE